MYLFMIYEFLYNCPHQVQWDEPATIPRPDRVSPWEIEPFVASASVDVSQPAMKIKRPRPLDLPLTGTENYDIFRNKSTVMAMRIDW